MGDCKPCEKKKKGEQNFNQATAEPVPVNIQRLYINCYCGLSRLIPAGLREGDEFELVPCPKCNTAFRGVFVGDGVEQL